jgi:predicted small integral membrane protein
MELSDVMQKIRNKHKKQTKIIHIIILITIIPDKEVKQQKITYNSLYKISLIIIIIIIFPPHLCLEHSSPLANGYEGLSARKLEQQSMKLAAQVL